MKRNSLFLFIFAFVAIFSNSYANPTNDKTDAMLFGDIKSGKEHIPFATIQVKGTDIGGVANSTGHFTLSHLPVGKQIIIASAVGYIPQEVIVDMTKGKSTEVYFNLKEDLLNLEQVVVTADRNKISRQDAAIVVSPISPKLLNSTGAVCLAEGLNYTPGLRLENNCQNCGFTQVRMNGLDGPYSQILINSRPIFSGLAGVYGLEQIPASMIQRVEVVRGGGSSLFGGNAIAGTINIITKDPVANAYQLSYNNSIVGLGVDGAGKEAIDQTADFNASIVSEDNKNGAYFFGSVRDKEGWDANNDGFTEHSKIKNSSLGFNAFHRFNRSTKLSLEYHAINEDRRGGDDLNSPLHTAQIAEAVKHEIHTGSLTLDKMFNDDGTKKLSTYFSAQNLLRNSYYGAEADPNGYGKSKQLSTNAGVQYFTKFGKLLFAPSSFVAGIENTYSNLTDRKLGGPGVDDALIADQYITTYGGFLQNEWNLDFMKILVGLRVDNYNIKDNEKSSNDNSNTVFVPRANLLFKPFTGTQLRLSYARGYRAPQIFDEDLHIEVSGSNKVIHINDDNLKEETSNSFSGSIDYTKSFDGGQLYLLAEGFYTKLLDPFVNEYDKNEKTGVTTSTRVNAAYDATVSGVNLEAKYAPNTHISFQTGFTIQKSVYDEKLDWGSYDDYESMSDKILRAPNLYGYALIDWEVTHDLKLSMSANYTGAMYAPHIGMDILGVQNSDKLTEAEKTSQIAEMRKDIDAGNVIEGEKLVKTDSFVELGMKVSYHFDLSNDICVELNAGVKNIFNSYQDDFDKGKNRDAGWIYGPNSPRTFYFGVKFGNLF